MARRIDLEKIRQLSWSTSTSYTAANIITYNIALGVDGTDLSRCFEGHRDFHAVPTFGTLPVIAIMGEVTKSMASFLPNFRPHNHVHGEHYLELKRPFPARAKTTTLETTAKVVDVVDRRTGVTVVVGITTVDAATGDEICYNEWTSFVMKVPGEGASTSRPSAQHQLPSRKPDTVVEHKTTPEQGALYRAASGDLNPLHIDPAVARAGGFPGPILTGTCTVGMGVLDVVDSFAGASTRFKSVKLRLSKPVFPGEVVRTEMWHEDEGGEGTGTPKRILYRQVVGTDKVVISQAVVEFHDDADERTNLTREKAKL